MTVADLIEELQKIKNQGAVVCLCVEGYTYAEISDVVDETVSPPERDGHIGNALLKLDSDSSIRRHFDDYEDMKLDRQFEDI